MGTGRYFSLFAVCIFVMAWHSRGNNSSRHEHQIWWNVRLISTHYYYYTVIFLDKDIAFKCRIKICIMYIVYWTFLQSKIPRIHNKPIQIVLCFNKILSPAPFHRVWISPLFPCLPESRQTPKEGESPTFFKRDLLAYLSAYKAPALQGWKDHITKHDMSQAK